MLILALGWTLSPTRHTIANYLWRAGATAYKHFTCFYVFLGAPFYERLEPFWCRIIAATLEYLPEDQVLEAVFDETTRKKSGKKIEGTSYYRNACGSARQEYRTLFGLNFVIAMVRLRLRRWPDDPISLPIGLALYLKEEQAQALGRVYRSRSELAREMLDRLCRVVGPDQTVRSLQDGGYSTKAFLRDLPENATVVGRFPISSKLYAAPGQQPKGKRGPKPKKGPFIGTAKTLAEADEGWVAHPEEDGAQIRVVEGFWASVLPGVWLRVVLVRRPALKAARSKTQRSKWLEGFFTTELSLSCGEILACYGRRWSVEIEIRESVESYGLGQDRCRRYERIVGANAFRLMMAAAQGLWFAQQLAQGQAVDLVRYRPWYRQKRAPSGFDIMWACRERLFAEGIMPTVGFWEKVGVIELVSPAALPRAA